MSASALAVGLLWGIAGLVVLTAVAIALVHRAATRVLVVAVAALLGLAAYGVHSQVSSLVSEHPGALCTDGVSWFGITLAGSDEQCAGWR